MAETQNGVVSETDFFDEEVSDVIDVSAIVKLEVPEERFEDDEDEGDDVDSSLYIKAKIKKPEAYELATVYPKYKHQTKLVQIKASAGGFDTEYSYVRKSLRGGIDPSCIKSVYVLPWYSHRDKRWYLWIINHNPGMGYYDSLLPLFNNAPEWYEDAAFTVTTDRVTAQYALRKHKAPSKAPEKPPLPTKEMLGQALGTNGVIMSADHHKLAGLTAGEPV